MKLAFTAGSLMTKLRFGVPLRHALKTKLFRVTNCISSPRHVSLFTSNFKASSEHSDDESELHIAQESENDINFLEDVFSQTHSVRNLLYLDTTDSLLRTLNMCASVQELLSVIEDHKMQFRCKHVTQAILVFWDLQRVFNHFSFINSTIHSQKLDQVNKDYLNKLNENATFLDLLNFINTRLTEFDLQQLSSILLYLNKMGFSVKHEMLQRLIEQFKIRLKSNKDEACLLSLSQFIACILKMGDLSYYYHVQEIVPIIFNHIDAVKSAEEFKLLTKCLNGLRYFVTDDVLSAYKLKVNDLIEQKEITSKNSDTILSVASFLSYNEWRDANTIFVSKQIMLLRTYLHLLSPKDLLTLYEVIYKAQEPADILNEAQRCAIKFFLQLEEQEAPIDIHLKLLLCIAYFASPSQRLYVEKFIRKFIDYDLSSFSMLYLQKIILLNKTADAWIYQTFWKKMLILLRDETYRQMNILRACNNYMTLNKNVNLYRCHAFENQMLDWLETEIENEGIDTLVPSKFSMIASFILIYGQKQEILRHCIKKIEENIEQFNHIDCFNLSRSLDTAINIKNRLLSADAVKKIRVLLDKCNFNNLHKGLGFNARNLLFKSYIYRSSFDKELLQLICDGYDEHQNLSSKLIKNICFCLYSTNILLPNVLDKMVDYVIEHKEHVTAVNAERLIYLCYCLGYSPKNSQQFLQIIVDMILRDQERLNGLSYLHMCLSLCYFHALPQSLMQHIFNVEFLEKLDAELTNCYFKGTYPLRVRLNMFYLNRAVCLDYPECNIPWFHRKYLDTIENKKSSRSDIQDFLKYLSKPNKSEQYIMQNELAPYGYNIDFVIHLDGNNKIVTPDDSIQKVGILLMPPKAYTKLNMQLKGRYQLQIRHLEMLGYKIIIVNLSEWNNLIYGETKINYLRKLIWPETFINKDIDR